MYAFSIIFFSLSVLPSVTSSRLSLLAQQAISRRVLTSTFCLFGMLFYK